MYNEGFEQWIKLNKNLTTPVSDWNKTVTEIMRRITQQNLEIIEDNFSRLSDQLKRLSTVKKPEEFFNLQRDCINENITASVQNLHKIVFMTLENVQEIAKAFTLVRDQASSIIKHTERTAEKVVEKAHRSSK